MVRIKILRENMVARNITGTLFLKVASFLITFKMMPLYIGYFDNQVILGIWYTLLSIFSWILMFDMGIGNGLRNRLSSAIATNQVDLQKKIISSSYVILGGLTLAIIMIGFPLIKIMDWNSILNITEDAISNKVLTNAILECVKKSL